MEPHATNFAVQSNEMFVDDPCYRIQYVSKVRIGMPVESLEERIYEPKRT